MVSPSTLTVTNVLWWGNTRVDCNILTHTKGTVTISSELSSLPLDPPP